MKRLSIKSKSDLHKICTDIQQDILKSDNTTIGKQLAYIAIQRIHLAIDNEFKNANNFLKEGK